ncbi:MAG: hypothetical protein J7L98_01635 [Candidatus Verstraetearchaeota archaeon]|nr:hypothetical protein [Candidatus Verstraetearchaeota archaeon]
MEYSLSKAAVVIAVAVLASLAAFAILSLSQAPCSLKESTTIDKLSLLTTTLDTLSRGAQSAILSFSSRVPSIYTLPEQPLVVVLDLPEKGRIIVNGSTKTLIFKGFTPTVEGTTLRRGTSYELLVKNDTVYITPLPSASYECRHLSNGLLLHKLRVHYLKFVGECSSAEEVIFNSSKLLSYQAIRIVPQDGSAVLSVNGLPLSNFTVSRGDLILMELLEQVIEVTAE